MLQSRRRLALSGQQNHLSTANDPCVFPRAYEPAQLVSFTWRQLTHKKRPRHGRFLSSKTSTRLLLPNPTSTPQQTFVRPLSPRQLPKRANKDESQRVSSTNFWPFLHAVRPPNSIPSIQNISCNPVKFSNIKLAKWILYRKSLSQVPAAKRLPHKIAFLVENEPALLIRRVEGQEPRVESQNSSWLSSLDS